MTEENAPYSREREASKKDYALLSYQLPYKSAAEYSITDIGKLETQRYSLKKTVEIAKSIKGVSQFAGPKNGTDQAI